MFVFITFLDFSCLYQNFFEEIKQQMRCPASHFDCSDIPGTNCYADEQAKQQLRQRIRDLPVSGLHFLDSGNYHYLSLLWLEKIREDFVLLLYDNHPDYQAPAFGNLTSCGGWVREAVETNPYIRKVWMVGIDPQLYDEEAPDPQIVERKQLEAAGTLPEQERKQIKAPGILPELEWDAGGLPIYVSIDKDVLSSEYAACDWSQGDMSLPQLLASVQAIAAKNRILGIDVCGEKKSCPTASERALNEAANRALLETAFAAFAGGLSA